MRLAGRLLVAASLDAATQAVRVIGFLGRAWVVDPCLCRALGHQPRAFLDGGGLTVATVCVRCGGDG